MASFIVTNLSQAGQCDNSKIEAGDFLSVPSFDYFNRRIGEQATSIMSGAVTLVRVCDNIFDAQAYKLLCQLFGKPEEE